MLSNITPRFIPHVVDEQLHAVIFADAYVRVGEQVHKAGHIPTDLALPAHARDDNGWGYVVRIGNQVIFCHGTTPHSVLSKITSRRGAEGAGRGAARPARCLPVLAGLRITRAKRAYASKRLAAQESTQERYSRSASSCTH